MNKTALIKSILKTIEVEQLIRLWRNYCYDDGNPDSSIYDNDEYTLEDMFSGFDHPVAEAIRATSYGEYSYTEPYVRINAYGNLQSLSSYEVKDYIDFDYLADYAIEHWPDLKEVWYEDFIYEFSKYFREKYNRGINWDCKALDEYNLVKDDWEQTAEYIFEDSKENPELLA